MECPHLGQSVKINSQFLDKLRSENIKSWNCVVCRSSKSPWICLRCGVVNCGSYTCDEFVVNDTKSTDIQRLREILLDAQTESPPKKRNLSSDSLDHPRKSLRLSNSQQLSKKIQRAALGRGHTLPGAIKPDDALLVEELVKFYVHCGWAIVQPIAPDALFSVVWKVVPRFRGFQQQDAHEFMHYLLDRVHTELLQSKKAFHGKETIVTGIFGGVLHSEVNCLECLTESKKLDPFLDLSLDIPIEFQTRRAKSKDHKVCQLTDCLQSFTDLETLQESEFYICPKCKVKRPSTKKFWLNRLPNVLILHLKRFKFISFLRSKIDTYVRCPLRGLDMRKHLLPSQQEKYSKEACVYDLAAVVVHHGSGVSAGHYTAYTWHEGHWYNFNDSCVTQTTEDVVARCKGYIYFYTRRQVDMSIIEQLKSQA